MSEDEFPPDGEKFRSKKSALREVSNTVASWLWANSEADLFGNDLNLTDAQRERLDWALEEVQRRLYKMGGRE